MYLRKHMYLHLGQKNLIAETEWPFPSSMDVLVSFPILHIAMLPRSSTVDIPLIKMAKCVPRLVSRKLDCRFTVLRELLKV